MKIEKPDIWHRLGEVEEKYLTDRVKSGQPCLLITGNERSFVVDLDWSELHDVKHHDEPDDISDFQEWIKMMILYTDRMLTQELVAGAKDFIRNSKLWLKPHQRNSALFFFGQDGDDVVFIPVPAAA